MLVGDGGDRPRLEQLARDLGVSEHVHFLRGLHAEQLFACYANCDVFALPSRGEGFGLVFLEAMALAKPVIGGAHGGIPDIVEDGVTGLLVPHGDVERLAEALESLFNNPVGARGMGERGRDRAAENIFIRAISNASDPYPEPCSCLTTMNSQAPRAKAVRESIIRGREKFFESFHQLRSQCGGSISDRPPAEISLCRPALRPG